MKHNMMSNVIRYCVIRRQLIKYFIRCINCVAIETNFYTKDDFLFFIFHFFRAMLCFVNHLVGFKYLVRKIRI
jgi:hypothetical protein